MTDGSQQPANVATIIVNYRTADYSIACVRALAGERQALPGLRVMLVDNASGDDSVARLQAGLADLVEAGFVSIVPLSLNGGFGWGNNQAILRLLAGPAPPDYIHLLNPDCIVQPGALSALLDELTADPRCGVTGSRLLDPDGTVSGSAFRFPSIGREFLRGARMAALGRILRIKPVLVTSDMPVNVDWVTGASCLFRVETLRRTGLFDEGFFLYFEEVELMHRLKQAGWHLRHVPASRVMHIGGAATGVTDARPAGKPSYPDYWYRSRRRYFSRTGGATVTVAANLAWLAGDAIAVIAAWIWPRRRDPSGGTDRRQLLACGLLADRTDRVSAIAWPGDAIDQPPYWMTSRP